MKTLKFWQSLLLAFTLLPALMFAQQFNNAYVFNNAFYTNSDHTDGVQISDGRIAEGGTITHPLFGAPNVVEIGLVGTAFSIPPPANGLMLPSPRYYADPNNGEMTAVDLVESTTRPNWVIQLANYIDPATGVTFIRVFRADPVTGVYSWARQLGNGLNIDLVADAIIREPFAGGDYYILGHTRNTVGFMQPYLARITDAGILVWESIYFDPNVPNASHESVDLLYNPVTNTVAFTTNRTLLPPGMRDGVVTIEVTAPAPGAVLAASHLPFLGGTNDFDAIDMDLMNNGEYAIVGRINTPVNQGFLLRYAAPAPPYLTPAVPFSRVYTQSAGIFMTGVKPYAGGALGMYVSFEWGAAAGFSLPGMAELTPVGIPVPGQSLIYRVPGPYLGSRGLIALNGNFDFAVKGALDFFGMSSLSLLADFTPLAPNPNPPICSDPITIGFYNNNNPVMIPFAFQPLMTDKKIKLDTGSVQGRDFDCNSNFLSNFKQAAPTGIDEKGSSLAIDIYPNPTDGNFTIQLSDDIVGMYQTGEIYNALGEVVLTFNVNSTIEKINLFNQVPGIYLIRLKTSDGNVSEAQRIMVK